VSAPTVVILAAGQGTRMKSSLPKVLHPICGRPMVAWPIDAAQGAGAGTVVVVDGPQNALNGHLPDGVALAIQQDPKGTGDAVKSAAEHIAPDSVVIILAGDVPLITPAAIRSLADAHAASGAAATMATIVLDDPTGYGRVVRAGDGTVERVVETKEPGDATPDELDIREVNSGVYAFDGAALLAALDKVTPDNAQGEYYLPDVLPIMRADGLTVAAHTLDDPELLLGVNDRVALAAVQAAAQRRIHERLMAAGVTIVDPASTTIDATVEIGPDTTIEPSSHLRGATTIGSNCVVGPLTTLIDTKLGDGVKVPHSYLVEAEAQDGVTIGPFAYLRPGALLREKSKVGTFVEVKNSDIGAGAKVPHLSYIGDADVGEGTNLGASTITANYDGRQKHRTKIGKNVKGGVDTSYVAPVEVGDGAWTAAGSVITDDIPPGALGVARERQKNIEDWEQRTAAEGDPKPGSSGGTEVPE
jgi:bifunctional UDP-N-acetylglucosamine pyrophosphorylase/glucosamine-1-phosphate N-acetyltransferase